MRESLQPFRNKNITVTATVNNVFYQSQFNIQETFEPNVRILMTKVHIGGERIDHIWLYERNKYYKRFKSLIGKRVKFKATVVPYVKKRDGIFIEDYGIKPRDKVFTIDEYRSYMNQMHKRG
ncbi:hypothetical protein [Staphylococcus massiliensis]|uniref:hypothetical protein n=1 Tax=Staphylococcus massiliensis TaxID=555791 RepID=UPI001EDF5B20|nr:hypothetical protein [Staphylococcus massiliensis]MCG3399176.1 hypothetical protein [Staphylococcus massiliensis]